MPGNKCTLHVEGWSEGFLLERMPELNPGGQLRVGNQKRGKRVNQAGEPQECTWVGVLRRDALLRIALCYNMMMQI